MLFLAGFWLAASAPTLAEQLLAHIYPIHDVREVVVNGGASLELVQGDTESLRAEATQEVLTRVKVDLSGQRLTLGVKSDRGGFFQWINHSDEHVRFVLQVKDLSRLELSGGVTARVGDLTVSMLKIDLSGSSHAVMSGLTATGLTIHSSGAGRLEAGNIRAEQLRLDMSGASSVDIREEGQVNDIRLDVSGASKYHGKSLASKTAWASASGASYIELRVEDSLEAHASGASHISYHGNPRTSQHSSGASRIHSQSE